MVSPRQLLKLYFVVFHLVLLIWFLRSLTSKFPVPEMKLRKFGGTNAEVKSMNTSVSIEEDEQALKNKERIRHEKLRKRFVRMIGGPAKVFEYYRDHVFLKDCERENEFYSEAKAKAAWEKLSERERGDYADSAVIFLMRGEYELEDYIYVGLGDYGL